MSEIELPGQNLTLEETIRVMDVAREMRDKRETAEEMFRQDDIRAGLREKLMKAARISGDKVTEAEIDVAIDQYLATVHAYQEPEFGMKSFMAHCWVWRDRILVGAVTFTAVVGSLLYLFG